MKHRRSILLAVLILIVLAVGWAWWRQDQSSSSNKLPVVASFYPMAEFARQVGGEHVDVETLIKPGTEPHDYDPSPREIARLHDARVFVYNGAGLEPWADKLTGELAGRGLVIVEAAQALPLQDLTEDGVKVRDPHVWLDPALAARQVDAIRDALIQADPVHRTDYETNAAAYQRQLTGLREAYEGLKACSRHEVVSTHQVMGYLSSRYGFTALSIAGLSSEEEPSPQKLAEVASFVKSRGLTYILTEPLVSPKFADTLARETGAQTLSFHPLESLTSEDIDDRQTYLSIQRQNIEILKRALECK
jgi:zinc transport system substrate-binding protein